MISAPEGSASQAIASTSAAAAPTPPSLPSTIPDFSTLLPLPQIAFGTHMLQGEAAEQGVYDAIMAGYRCIDTASRYFNEKEVERAISRSGVGRDSLFLITKIGPHDTKRGKEAIVKSFNESLANLKTSYLDCYLMHWPGVGGLAPEDPKNIPKRLEAWQTMLELKQQGLVRYVGVSNFKLRHFESIAAAGLPLPDVHQTELHPLCRQIESVAYCNEHKIQLQQYSPLAKTDHRLFEHPAMVDATARLRELLATTKLSTDVVTASASPPQHGVTSEFTAATVCLLWGRYKGFASAAVRSTNVARIASNLCAVQMYDTHIAPYADRITVLAELDAVLAIEPDIHTCWESSKVA